MKNKIFAMRDVRRTLREQIIIYKRVDEESIYISTFNEDDFQEFKKIRAEQRYIKTVEKYTSDSPTIIISKEFVIRYREDLTEDMVIKHRQIGQESIYQIEGILPLENEKLYLKILVKEIKTKYL